MVRGGVGERDGSRREHFYIPRTGPDQRLLSIAPTSSATGSRGSKPRTTKRRTRLAQSLPARDDPPPRVAGRSTPGTRRELDPLPPPPPVSSEPTGTGGGSTRGDMWTDRTPGTSSTRPKGDGVGRTSDTDETGAGSTNEECPGQKGCPTKGRFKHLQDLLASFLHSPHPPDPCRPWEDRSRTHGSLRTGHRTVSPVSSH